MLWSLPLLWACFAPATLTALASPGKPLSRRWADVAEVHSWNEIPRGWKVLSSAPPDYPLNMRIGLKQYGMDELIENLLEISDPTHPRYTQHLTKEEANAFKAPHKDASQAVDEWLAFHDINLSSADRTPSGDWISITIPVSQAEALLNTEYHLYEHLSSGEQVIRTLRYSLPRELHAHVDVVAPTTYFGTLKSMKATSFLLPNVDPVSVGDYVAQAASEKHSAGAASENNPGAVLPSCNNTITPACLRALYKTYDYTPASTDKNALGVVGYLNEFANKMDHQMFFKTFRADVPATNAAGFETVLVNGGQDDQSKPGVEANLDIQYTTGISYPTPNTYYSVGGSPPFQPDSFTTKNTNEPYLDFIEFIYKQDKIPQTLSTSYGDDEQTVPRDYAERVCKEFAAIGSRGVSIFFSSGDSGVGGGACTTNDGTNRTTFQPSFPASCPYVTTVGATVHINPEVAIPFSGGGFSNYFAAPAYQGDAVSNYLWDYGTRNKGMFNRSGRAYPDVSAQGVAYQVVVRGMVTPVGGTSASTPTVASIFALLNDHRISQNKAPLGFINPLLYSTLSSGFTDITQGSNPGCGTDGFSAARGWDPVTGLGTPDFQKLLKLIEGL
ncbi:hypothetical protein D9613_003707 [Agrocybe pediades]|uniref:tripeptidyl-peptidase II n=1 Tax=Agrocybe pediades TaxID=84607 RepID=A0A8H4VLE1_9AGAR|nr:hypothetical protein D9613_003707 [Agrocybe pediades]